MKSGHGSFSWKRIVSASTMSTWRTGVRSEATRPFMGASPGSAHVFVVVLERHVDERLPAVDLLAHRPRERAHPEHHAAVVVVEPLGERVRHPRALVGIELARDRVDVLVVGAVAEQVEGPLRVNGALPAVDGLVVGRLAVVPMRLVRLLCECY